MGDLYRTGIKGGSPIKHAVADGKPMSVMVVAVCGEIVRSEWTVWDKSAPGACADCINPPKRESLESIRARTRRDHTTAGDVRPEYGVAESPNDDWQLEHALVIKRRIKPVGRALCGVPARLVMPNAQMHVAFDPAGEKACGACVKAWPP
ncbi:hypothetical protein [Acrocarpospora sp. B8E8]|uniref:hypothetical protein n=1 Tax=Acrocarpospora sp. B8E8 TaxID=3153572 RepID=UPI00325F8F6E